VNAAFVALNDLATLIPAAHFVDNSALDMTNHIPSPTRAFFNLKEAAQYTGISVRTLRRAVTAGLIAHNRSGLSERSGKILIRLADLDAYLAKGRIA